MKSKKGLNRLIAVVIALPIILAVSLLGTIGFYEIGQEFIIEDISNTTRTIGQNLNISQSYITKIEEGEANFNSIDFKYDLYYIIILLFTFGATAIAAIKSDRNNPFTFLGMLTFGSMGLLLILFFIDQFVDYWLNDFFYQVFDGVTQNTFVLDWFFDNLSLISILWFVILLLLNQIEINVQQLFQRRQENENDIIGGRNIEE